MRWWAAAPTARSCGLSCRTAPRINSRVGILLRLSFPKFSVVSKSRMSPAETTDQRRAGGEPNQTRAAKSGMVKTLFWAVLATSICFLLAEGLSSVVLILTAQRQIMAETRHTRYDSQLGWTNIPNLYVADMYGPGVYLRTNSRGFRNNREFAARVPVGKLRLICSGASFTFGYGVSNDQNWCQVLEAQDSRLETINLGEGAYGLDQSFLAYRREAATLETDVDLLAV